MGSTSAQVISHWRCVVSPVLGAVALSLASTAALADTETEQGGGPVEEVIVTAQKRSESLQSVPVSVTALSAAQLAQTKLDTPADLVAHVPNMQQQGVIGEGTPLFALRGVSMFDYSPSQNTPVGTYMDEVYKGSFVLLGVEMYDLERIEVLAGPQGTLYGKATTGGAINFIANKPGFEPEAYVKVGYGNYDRREVEGAAQTGLIPDKVAIRVAATYTKVDGFVENV
ncbi:MAG TPA: TonB-dependent receptor plug domain-containing protein, partial [Steroidobacteraceae bacterium]|nr:TonB-dependent receptor plug domain-containing protein [Steroidobacteraceae bacterium]